MDRTCGTGASSPRAGAGRGSSVREIISATHMIADLTLGLGEVVHDYLV
jgi:hypothetical protein